MWGFGLTRAAAREIIKEYNTKCDSGDEWCEAEIEHKIHDALTATSHRREYGYLRDASNSEYEESGSEIHVRTYENR